MKTIQIRFTLISLMTILSSMILFQPSASACTGIALQADDGDVVVGRTLEWGLFDVQSAIMIIPKGYKFVAETPEGKNGMKWTGKYGVAGINALGRPILFNGMNETGMVANLFYHPGFAEYAEYDPSEAKKSMAPTDVMSYILTSFATVAEVRESISKIKVVNVVEESLGFPAPIHLRVCDETGDKIVIEFTEGKIKVYEAQLGVITNAPNYDWHITNLRNYVNLSSVGIPTKTIDELDFNPLGVGSGMLGLPGDFTPPSRFIRAVAWSKTARSTADGPETVYELLRILDNFNVPLEQPEEVPDLSLVKGMRSSTQWTTASDINNKVFYYHTQHNRQVRKIDVGSIDFGSMKDIQTYPLDEKKEQAIKDRTPKQ